MYTTEEHTHSSQEIHIGIGKIVGLMKRGYTDHAKLAADWRQPCYSNSVEHPQRAPVLCAKCKSSRDKIKSIDMP